jgi:hypothetical protein
MKENKTRRVEQVLCDEGFCVSFGQARRLIGERAVKIDGVPVTELNHRPEPGLRKLKVGRLAETSVILVNDSTE